MESSRSVPNVVFSGKLLYNLQVLEDVDNVVDASPLHSQFADDTFEPKRLLLLVPEVSKDSLA